MTLYDAQRGYFTRDPDSGGVRDAADATLREEVEKLTQPPAAYGTFLGVNDDGTVVKWTGNPGTDTPHAQTVFTAPAKPCRRTH